MELTDIGLFNQQMIFLKHLWMVVVLHYVSLFLSFCLFLALLWPPLLQYPVQQVISLVPVWFPVTLVRGITTSLIMAALTACPAPFTEPPPSPGQPPYSTAPVSDQEKPKSFLNQSHTNTDPHTLSFFVFEFQNKISSHNCCLLPHVAPVQMISDVDRQMHFHTAVLNFSSAVPC